MNMIEMAIPIIYLKPGEIYVAREPAVVQTVLGSCVSVTMHDRSSGTGIISHGLLPRCGDRGACRRACAEEHKYVECSIRRMIESMDSLKARRRDIEVKMFGGADMFTSGHSISESITVGKQNIETALKTLKTEGLHPSSSDVGGNAGRKIYFYAHTGEVLLKRLKGNIDIPGAIRYGLENFSMESAL